MATLRKKHGGTDAAEPAATTAAASPKPAASSAAAASITSSTLAPRFDPPTSRSWPAPALVSAFVLALYLRTVYPSLTGGDSGELLMTTCNLGLAHPPGYPLFTMLGWAWGRVMWPLLFGDQAHQAYRINCMSAALGAVAAAMMAATASRLASRTAALAGRSAGGASVRFSGATMAGVFAAVGFAATPTVWLYSIQSEVFALNNALMAGLLLLTVVYYTREENIEMQSAQTATTKKTDVAPTSAAATAAALTVTAAPTAPLTSRSLVALALGGAFLCGLCLTNQHTTVFPVVATSAFISWSLWRQGQLSLARVGQLVAAVLLGMSPYLYLYFRSHYRVIDSWGDQRTLSGFLTHLLRSEYGTFQLAASEISTDPGMRSRLAIYAENMREEMMVVTPWLGLIGALACLCSSSRAVRRSALCICTGTLLYVVVFHKLANLDLRPLFLGVQARFWMQSNQALWIFAGVGLVEVAQRIAAVVGRFSRSVKLASSLGGALSSAYCLCFLFWHLARHYPAHNHSRNDSFFVAGRSMLESFPPNSIVLLNGDLNNNLVKYPQQCEGLRPDLSLLSLQLMSWEWFVPMQRANYPAVVFPGIRYHVSTPQSFPIRRFLDANISSKKAPGGIFLCGAMKEGDHSNVRTLADPTTGAQATNWYEEHPFGLCSQLLPHGRSPANASEFLRRGWGGLTRLSELPPYDPLLFGPATWERVLYKDNWTRLLYLFSYAAFHSNQDQTGAGFPAMLELARDLAQEVLTHEALLKEQGHVGSYEYRSMGVIFGMWARQLANSASKAPNTKAAAAASKHRQSQIDASHRSMLYSWSQYCLITPGDRELFPSVRDRINPYTGQAIPVGVVEADPALEALRQKVIRTYAEAAEAERERVQQIAKQQAQQKEQKQQQQKQQQQQKTNAKGKK